MRNSPTSKRETRNLIRQPDQIPSSPLPVDSQSTTPPASAPPAALQKFPSPPPLRHYLHDVFQPLTFHPRTHGVNIRMGSDCQTAARQDSEFCNGYVFSSRPINPGESWVVQIVQAESIYRGGMGFGFTTCNPASLASTDLPDDANELLDRPEYWVISKDAHEPIVGDEIEFHLSHNGEVTMMINHSAATVLMHVDVSLPLWAIFDVHGSTQAIRLLGTICPPQPDEQPVEKPISQSAAGGSGSNSECIVCCDSSVDCVLNSCGHMCLCYDCALKLHEGGQGLCPICRASIRDVIRAYLP